MVLVPILQIVVVANEVLLVDPGGFAVFPLDEVVETILIVAV